MGRRDASCGRQRSERETLGKRRKSAKGPGSGVVAGPRHPSQLVEGCEIYIYIYIHMKDLAPSSEAPCPTEHRDRFGQPFSVINNSSRNAYREWFWKGSKKTRVVNLFRRLPRSAGRPGRDRKKNKKIDESRKRTLKFTCDSRSSGGS